MFLEKNGIYGDKLNLIARALENEFCDLCGVCLVCGNEVSQKVDRLIIDSSFRLMPKFRREHDDGSVTYEWYTRTYEWGRQRNYIYGLLKNFERAGGSKDFRFNLYWLDLICPYRRYVYDNFNGSDMESMSIEIGTELFFPDRFDGIAKARRYDEIFLEVLGNYGIRHDLAQAALAEVKRNDHFYSNQNASSWISNHNASKYDEFGDEFWMELPEDWIA